MYKTSITIILNFILISCISFDHKNSYVERKISNLVLKQEQVNAKKSSHDFHTYHNAEIDRWIAFFLKKGRLTFESGLRRGRRYKEVIQTTLEDEELPALLYYLPLIESGYKIKAYSHANAVGPWQFVKGTGLRYGLKINYYLDERRDPILATRAAVKYLKDLYNVFHSWELAMAAYNCGEVRVLRAIMKGKTRDFWKLSEKKLLPRETRNYVPKVLAAAFLGQNYEDYQFLHNPSSFVKFPDVEAVNIPGGISLRKISQIFSLNFTTLQRLNPSLRRRKTPLNQKKYPIWIPSSFVHSLRANIAKLKPFVRKIAARKSHNFTYRVKKGDTISVIARRFKINQNHLQRINRIRKDKIFIGQKLYLGTRRYESIKGNKFYFVQKGDYLKLISSKFKLELKYLKKLNGLFDEKLYIGQKLNVSKGKKTFHYRVKRGDNLSKIADLFHVKIRSIMKKNSIKNSKIYAGQLLVI